MNWIFNAWTLNALSIIVFFIGKYFYRNKKTVGFSWKYWFSDNWPEFSMTLLLNLIFMIVLNMPEANQAISKLPEWVTFLGKPGIAIALGLGLSWVIYGMFWKKSKDALKKG